MVRTAIIPSPDDEPTDEELAAIERESPLIQAEMVLVDAEARVLILRRPTELDWRRLRRAETRVLRQLLALSAELPLSDLAA